MIRAMWGLQYVAALLLALPPVSGPAWRGVVRDWLDDNRFQQPHSCGAVLVAFDRLETMSMPAGYSRIVPDVGREAQRACGRGRPAEIRVGMSDAAVAAVAGLPRLALGGSRCWVYPTRRVCFTNGRAGLVRLVSHG